MKNTSIFTLLFFIIASNCLAVDGNNTKNLQKNTAAISLMSDHNDSFYMPKQYKISVPKGTVSVKTTQFNSSLQRKLNDGFVAFSEGHVEVALDSYKSAYQQDSENIDAAFGVAVCYQLLGQSESASNLYREILQKKPDYYPAKNNVIILISGKSFDEAIKELKNMLKSQKNNPFILAQIGTLYSNSGNNYDEAIYYLSSAIEKEPSNPTYTYNLAVTFDNIKRYKEAYNYYSHTISILHDSFLVDRNIIEDRMRYLKNCIGVKTVKND